ncbi:GCC2 and GCC3 domain containing protein [Entamoeba histolytica HM-1:IMSS-B]|uniref:Tyrosine-protein kinase ephrin type A/B receptor-like domain-containing protein n=5 Tax=Entamoeba histolytica TaxID=5759 RepID=C4LST1_ENTH1|nr:hypothetical protein EHI_152440 [Entamoeba histolytica HM-1:IMSS]EMH78125.1 GCC2 and GCC3 domain containing protein [Entamoeba histolytica HM-1:IMSS-B]EMS10812.1 GCC2 and GCC3 domain containing protein [Entamoeba histolytica HM-3:IMSS]ENY60697.1 GCC2 and GCC3 domain containing protein [Entamoeba histolytica HM-1:IMSS-A]GAT91497.1 hypothetical protein CL6EHI_152440 [Entamoeba histolytica]EAL51585.1 hypothetical protein EHI_152440 [Entamoeba histolytica HM-1:IMSS]|eukprot:XP_656967.1 hypothetical protein EHI_152440 [Entamoeba histolytica HM-1:IMSS]
MLFFLFIALALSTSYIWTGANSNLFDSSSNWSPIGIPNLNDNAIICPNVETIVSLTSSNQASLIIGGVSCNNVTLELVDSFSSGGSYTISNNGILSIQVNSVSLLSLTASISGIIKSTVVTTLTSPSITINSGCQMTGDINVISSGSVTTDGTISVSSLVSPSIIITSPTASTIATSFGITNIKGSGTIIGDVVLNGSGTISSMITVQGKVTGTNLNLVSFFKKVNGIDISNSKIISNSTVSSVDSSLTSSILDSFIFDSIQKLIIKGTVILNTIEGSLVNFILGESDTLILSNPTGTLNTQGGQVTITSGSIIATIDSELAISGTTLIIGTIKKSFSCTSSTKIIGSTITFSSLSEYFCPTDGSTLTFNEDVIVGHGIFVSSTFIGKKRLEYIHSSLSTSVTIENDILSIGSITGSIELNGDILQLSNTLTATSLKQKSGTLTVNANSNSLAISTLILTKAILNNVTLSEATIDMSFGQSLKAIGSVFSSITFMNNNPTVELIDSNVSGCDWQIRVNLYGMCNLEQCSIKEVFCDGKISMNLMNSDKLINKKGSFISFSYSNSLCIENYGSIESLATFIYKLVNFETGTFSTNSVSLNILFINYGTLSITKGIGTIIASTGSQNFGNIDGFGKLRVNFIEFTNGGNLQVSSEFLGSIINLYQNATFLSDSVLFDGCSIVIKDIALFIETVKYINSVECPQAIMTTNTIIEKAECINKTVKIQCHHVEISASNLGANELSFNGITGFITTSVISTLRITNNKMEFSSNTIDELYVTTSTVSSVLTTRYAQVIQSTIKELECVKGDFFDSTIMNLIISQETTLTNLCLTSATPYQYSTFDSITTKNAIHFIGSFKFGSFTLGSSDDSMKVTFDSISIPSILNGTTVVSTSLKNVYCYNTVQLFDIEADTLTNYGTTFIDSTSQTNIITLILKSGSSLHSTKQMIVNSISIEEDVETDIDQLSVSKSLDPQSDIHLVTLILIESCVIVSSNKVIYVDNIVSRVTTNIKVNIVVGKQCAELMFSTGLNELNTTTSFSGNCIDSEIFKLNNYGVYEYLPTINLLKNFNITKINGNCPSLITNYNTLILSDANVTNFYGITCYDGSIIKGNGEISVLSVEQSEGINSPRSTIELDGQLTIKTLQNSPLDIIAKIEESGNDILIANTLINELMNFQVIIGNFVPLEPKKYVIFQHQESTSLIMNVTLKDIPKDSPWRYGTTLTTLFVEYFGCEIIYNPESKLCEKCQGGQLFNPETRKCEGCDSGMILKNQQCVACPAGYFQSQNECVECQLGTYSTEKSTSCSKCPFGYTPNEKQTDCVFCPVGTHFIDEPYFRGCYPCDPGTYRDEQLIESFNCSKCPVGSASAVRNAAQCQLCDKGHYQDKEGEYVCKRCSEGTYSDVIGATSCKVCPDGFFPYPDRSRCFTCQAGMELAASGCKDCQPGYYKNTTGKSCLPCPKGTFQKYPGKRECKRCEIEYGKYVNENRTMCFFRKEQPNVILSIIMYTLIPLIILLGCGIMFLLSCWVDKKEKKKRFKVVAKIDGKNN